MEGQIARLEAVAARLEAAVANMGGEELSADQTPAYVDEWDALVKGACEGIVKAFDGIKYPGPKKEEFQPAVLLKCALDNVRAYIATAHKFKKPSQAEMLAFMKPLQDAKTTCDRKLVGTRNKKLYPFDNHHKALLEVFNALMWVAYYPPNLPATQAQSGWEACQFNLNRVLSKDGKSPENKAFLQSFSWLKNMPAFVKKNFKMGIEFNNKDGAAFAENDGSGAAAVCEKKAEPAQEVEEKKEQAAAKKPAAEKKKAGPSAMEQLKQGLAVTSGLRKVKKSEKTKYRTKEERSGKVTMKAKKAAVKKNIKPPKISKRGVTWYIENYVEGVTDINLDFFKSEGANLRESLYITNCYNCAFRIDCKVKSVVLDSCKKVQVQMSADLVSGCEIVNCKSAQVFFQGYVPSLQIDKCDSPKVTFTPSAALKGYPEIVTSCVTAGNAVFPKDPNASQEEMDYVTYPFAEQFVNTIGDGKVYCKQMEHAG